MITDSLQPSGLSSRAGESFMFTISSKSKKSLKKARRLSQNTYFEHIWDNFSVLFLMLMFNWFCIDLLSNVDFICLWFSHVLFRRKLEICYFASFLRETLVFGIRFLKEPGIVRCFSQRNLWFPLSCGTKPPSESSTSMPTLCSRKVFTHPSSMIY